MPGSREAAHIHGAELLQPHDTAVHQVVIDIRDLHQGNLVVVLRAVDIQVLNVGELRAFIHAQPGDNRDLLLAFLQNADRGSAHARGGGIGDIHIRDAGQVGAIRIDGQRDLRILVSPFIARALCEWESTGRYLLPCRRCCAGREYPLPHLWR